MSRSIAFGIGVLVLMGCTSMPAKPAKTLVSGVDLQFADRSIRPQDDLYRYLNGKWLETFQLPPDKATYGSFTHIDDTTQEQLREIVEGLEETTISSRPRRAHWSRNTTRTNRCPDFTSMGN
jgi:predicted metalloendopeptidase